ncbi:NAD(P)/FAD-dependent oxidoreductase [Nonomuraea sp. NPDC055795]
MDDVFIAGAGPAGLNAALTLGRARRRVLLADAGPGRNATSGAVHNFLSRDGITPAELRQAGLDQLAAYPSVRIVQGQAVRADGPRDDFTVRLADGSTHRARRLLLATGVRDELPPVAGLAERWGRGVLHCPYCHGFERRELPLAVLENGGWGVHLAVHLRRFSDDVVLCTNGGPPPAAAQQALLSERGITVRPEPIERLHGAGGELERITFAGGAGLKRRALFVHPHTRQHSDLPAQLGCRMLEDGAVEVDELGQSSVTGVWAAGDMARRPSMPLSGSQAVIAAADGLLAAVIIDQDLLYAAHP